MKLVMYSGGDFSENPELNTALLRLTNKKKPRITFIPSSCGHGEAHFGHFSLFFKENLGVDRFFYFPVDNQFKLKTARTALLSDIIYLSGGNTFHFLKNLQKSGMLTHLRKYVDAGGILSGMSAGAIIITPNIRTAGFPEWDRDDNDVRLKNLKSLDLVDFEFFPHFENTPRHSAELSKYSRNCRLPLIASSDGGGIVVNGKETRFIGETTLFLKGKKAQL